MHDVCLFCGRPMARFFRFICHMLLCNSQVNHHLSHHHALALLLPMLFLIPHDLPLPGHVGGWYPAVSFEFLLHCLPRSLVP